MLRRPTVAPGGDLWGERNDGVNHCVTRDRNAELTLRSRDRPTEAIGDRSDGVGHFGR